MKKTPWAGILCAVSIVAFTGYLLLDTFLLRTAITTNISTNYSSAFDAAAVNNTRQTSAEDPLQSDDSVISSSISAAKEETSVSDDQYADYSNENISINLTEYTFYDTKVYVADVELTSAEYLKTAFAEDSYGRNITEKTSDIAEDNDAIFAVNGDYYGAQETGYVIRNGVIYRSTSASDTEILCIYTDGSMEIRNTGDVSAEELVEEGVWQVLSFGPALIEDGSIAVAPGEEVGKSMASNPRTAIGITAEGHYLFVVSDGRTNESEGLSLSQLAEIMQDLGAVTAYNLDGGGSSTMWFMGELINNPTTSGNRIKERSVSDIVFIG